MTKKSLIVTMLLTVVLVVASLRLFVSQKFWNGWDNNSAYLEVYNAGNENNAIEGIDGKKVIILNPSELYNPEWMKKGGKGALISFKLRPKFRKYNAVFSAVGNGDLIIIFKNFEWKTDTKNIRVDFKDIVINGQHIINKKFFTTNDKLQDVLKVKSGEHITISFEAKKYFSLSELIFNYVDWYIFIIVLTVAFFVSYKVVNYLAKFKIQKGSSRIDIVFVFLFFVLLFLPMSKISDEEKSEGENRVLAKYHALYDENGINFRFGQQFEQWFNDRFWGRDNLISVHDSLHSKIVARGNKNVLLGKDDWLYMASPSVVSVFKNTNLFSDKELKIAGDNISNFVSDVKKLGVKDVYFYLSNDKESLYSEFYPSYITKQANISRLEQLISFVKNNHSDIKIFNFKDKFEQLKREGETVFCKTGTHMNGVGSFYEYKFLLEEMKKDYPMIKEVILQDLVVKYEYNCDKDLYNMLKDNNYSKENLRNKLLLINNIKAKVVFDNKRFDKNLGQVSLFENKDVKNNLKVLLISDSFALGWRSYLAEGVSSLYHIFTGHGLDFMYFPEELEYMKANMPDIIIVETTERFLQRFLNFQFPKLD